MTRIFLSYSHEDVAKAKLVAAALERHGHEVWWDRELHGGARFGHEIEAALKRSDVVAVLWSSASVQSAWVQDEAAEGRDSGRLVPVLVDDCQPPLGFRQYQAINLSGWNGRSTAPALRALNKAVLAKAATGAPAEAPPAEAAAATSLRRGQWWRRGYAVAAAVLLLIAAAGLLYWDSTRSGPDEGEALRVQLAGFTSLSPEVPQSVPEIFREELLAALGTDAIIVASSQESKASGKATSYAVKGSVRKAGDELRFTIHLADALSGDNLWTLTLDRPFSSMELAARQVAMGVSQVLRCGLTGAAQHPKTLPSETVSLYLAFCQEFWGTTLGNPENSTRGLHLARRLTQAAPDFSRGWSALGSIASIAVQEGVGGSPAAVRAEAKAAAERAIRLDPKNSEAYRVLSELLPPSEYARREALHIKSVSVRRSDCGCEYVVYGFFLSEVGRINDAAAAFKRAHDMIPLSAATNVTWVESLLVAGQEREARARLPTIVELWPDNMMLRRIMSRSALWTGRYGEAVETLTDPRTRLSDDERTAFAAVFKALQSKSPQDNAKARHLLLGLAKRPSGDSAMVISALAALGADGEALAFASRLNDGGEWWPTNVLFEPPLARARQSPQFAALVQRMGLLQYWRGTGRRPDFCKVSGAPPVCRSL